MVLRNNQSSSRPTSTNAPAFVMCPAAWGGWMCQGQPHQGQPQGGQPQGGVPAHPMYAYAFEQARRAVARQAFHRLTFLSLN